MPPAPGLETEPSLFIVLLFSFTRSDWVFGLFPQHRSTDRLHSNPLMSLKSTGGGGGGDPSESTSDCLPPVVLGGKLI